MIKAGLSGSLSGRLFARHWRQIELKMLVLALLLAVTGVTTIGFFAQRLQGAMELQASTMLGADRVLTSPRPFEPALLTQLQQAGSESVQAMQFASMLSTLSVTHPHFQLASVLAVPRSFPLKGNIRIKRWPGETRQVSDPATWPVETLQQGPAPGQIWLQPRLVQLLELQPGDKVQLGRVQLSFNGIIVAMPNQAAGFMGFAPIAMMNVQDVAASGVIQQGSRLVYQLYIQGGQLARLDQWARHNLNRTQRWLGARDADNALGQAITRGEKYLRLASLVSVILAGIAVAMASRRYVQHHLDAVAMMRCLGLSRRQSVLLMLKIILTGAAFALLLGALLGYLAHYALVWLLADLLPAELPAASIKALLAGVLTVLAMLLGFVLPPLLQLMQVSPLRVLRRDLNPPAMAAWLSSTLALLVVLALGWWQIGDLKLVLLMLFGAALLAAVLWSLARLALYFIALRRSGFIEREHQSGLVHHWHFARQYLHRFRHQHGLLISALALAMTVMAITAMLRLDLIADWQQKVPADAPNYFLINIEADERQAILDFLARHQLPHSGLYPMVRGRVVQINQQDVAELDLPQAESSLRRELNLTWADSLGEQTHVVEGSWFKAEDQGQAKISVETAFAERLHLTMGDKLTLQIGADQIQAEVVSLREVDWDSFKPNFFIIFPPGVLDGFPGTYITSFYSPPAMDETLAELVKRFPTVSLIDLSMVLKQVQQIVQQVTLAVEFVLMFVLLAGLLVLWAALMGGLEARRHAVVIMKTLGANKRMLQQASNLEFVFAGLLAALLALTSTEAVAWLLYALVFDLPFRLHGWLWLVVPVISVSLVWLVGSSMIRNVFRVSAVEVLRS